MAQCSISNHPSPTAQTQRQQRQQQKQQQEQQEQCALVATVDGSIWKVPLLKSEAESIPVFGTSVATNTSYKPSINDTIQIPDSDDDGQEEVELWNDEDGLVDTIDKLESSISPVAKRQRISPLSSNALRADLSLSKGYVAVDRDKHFVGTEMGATRLILALGGLLIFRKDHDPILWTSPHLLAAGATVQKQALAIGRKLHDDLSIACHDGASFVLCATKSGTIYRLHGSATSASHVEGIHATELHSMHESISSLVLIPSQEDSESRTLAVVGTIGGIKFIDLDAMAIVPSPKTISIDKTSVGASIRSALLAEAHVYFLTSIGRMLRIPLSSLQSGRMEHLEHLDLPRLRAFTSVPEKDTHGIRRQIAPINLSNYWLADMDKLKLCPSRATKSQQPLLT
ncbi:hypothetical protein EDD11_002886 [Mortierella claussenii]|nr:hypothetical protein EDD11_002886 [Mortierella claussenii]